MQLKNIFPKLLFLLTCFFLFTAPVHAKCPKKFQDLNPQTFRSANLKKPVKNLILMIGDGFGPIQLEATFPKTKENTPPFSLFPNRGQLTHCSFSGVTDSAAAATAMASGIKTNNRKIGLTKKNLPVKTILEIAKEKGKWTGLVTNTEITHATPASFAAHQKSRYDAVEIARDYINLTRPNILLGGGRKYFSKIGLPVKWGKITPFEWGGYQVVRSQLALRKAIKNPKTNYILGIFSNEHMEYEKFRKKISIFYAQPSLSQMATETLKFLSRNPNGFFLMIEGGRIDHAGHKNDLSRLVWEVKEFANTIDLVMKWAKKNPNTLLLVTADHETGGLKREKDGFHWTTIGHTATPVWIWGMGPNSDTIKETQDNRAVFHILNQAMK